MLNAVLLTTYFVLGIFSKKYFCRGVILKVYHFAQLLCIFYLQRS